MKNKSDLFIFLIKKTTVQSFEGDTFSQAPGVLVLDCEHDKIAARWRCGIPIKESKGTIKKSVFCQFSFCIDDTTV